jgi:di/tricarboxylate transporter
MSMDILMVFVILGTAVTFLVTEWIPMEVTALLVLGTVALTGLISPGEALAGFSNPAVVTVWAVFVLSGGLTRTGVANIIGRFVLRLSGHRETMRMVVIMLCAGSMSALMNNVAVAALMMPVVMDIARQTETPASRLLLPLAYGSLLGGLTTQIGTPPNILVSEALRENGLEPFGLFDYTPVGLTVMAAGVLFMALVGRRLLPDRDLHRDPKDRNNLSLQEQYRLKERMFRVNVPTDSALIGRSLAESRIGTMFGLNVVGIHRGEKILSAPPPTEPIMSGDFLIVESRNDIGKLRLELDSWSQLSVVSEGASTADIISESIAMREVTLSHASEYIGKSLYQLDFRRQLGANVLAIRRDGKIQRTHLANQALLPGDVLLLQGTRENLSRICEGKDFSGCAAVPPEALHRTYQLNDRLLLMRLEQGSPLAGRTLRESRLGSAVRASVLALKRRDGAYPMPEPDMPLQVDDQLLVAARDEDFKLLSALRDVKISSVTREELAILESPEAGLIEAMLSPHGTLAGKTLSQLDFRHKYGLTVLAIWREGRLYRAGFLLDMALRLGDALLLYGPRGNIERLGRDSDFIVLSASVQEPVRENRAKIAMAIMAGVLIPTVLGWIPIYLAAVIGAAFMVVTGCLTMDEAYRAIEWKGIVLIAGMMPLGTALDTTGAAAHIAQSVVGAIGPMGPAAVTAALMLLTFAATCVVPTAALVVLMVPIILSTTEGMGLSPDAMMMAMAIAASSSFMTPISHPANVMVMGPGGYRFIDYIKVGFPLTIVVLITVMLVLPLFWPYGP